MRPPLSLCLSLLAGPVAARAAEGNAPLTAQLDVSPSTAATHGRLLSRVHSPDKRDQAPSAGIHPLRPGRRGGVLVVPSTYRPSQPAPLLVFFHGAGGDSGQGLSMVKAEAEARGALLLVPESRGGSWDFIVEDYGVDVAALDQALAEVFDRFNVDARHVVASGFSDGASYALSLGIANGDVFTHVLAFSPGFAAPAEKHGVAQLFLSHGRADTVLPIDRCSRRLAPMLERAGYPVHYVEFEGGHAVPPQIKREAFEWAFAEGRDATGGQ